MIYECKLCCKIYSSYKSLWRHNNTFHPQNSTKSTQISTISTQNSTISTISTQKPLIYLEQTEPSNAQIQCIYCNKKLSRIDSKKRHEKNCKTKAQQEEKQKEKNNDLLKLQILKEEVKLKKEETKLLRLKQQGETLTICKINKRLEQLENLQKIQININNVNCNNTINSNNTNTQFNPLIYDMQKPIELQTVMSESKMKHTIKQGYRSLETLIEFLHCGEIDEYRNLIVTNQKNNLLYVFDEKTNRFIADLKSKVIKSLIENRMTDIENIMDSISGELDDKTKIVIRNFIQDMQENKRFINDGVAYESYCHYVTDKIILLLYNNHQKVLTDISSHIEKTNVKVKETIDN